MDDTFVDDSIYR
jgi:hypothetical protein